MAEVVEGMNGSTLLPPTGDEEDVEGELVDAQSIDASGGMSSKLAALCCMNVRGRVKVRSCDAARLTAVSSDSISSLAAKSE